MSAMSCSIGAGVIPTTRAAAEHNLLQHVARTEAALERASMPSKANDVPVLAMSSYQASPSSLWDADSTDEAAVALRSPALPSPLQRWPESPIALRTDPVRNGSGGPEFDQRVDTVRNRLARLQLPAQPDVSEEAEWRALVVGLEKEREELAEECEGLKLSLWEVQTSQLRAEEDGKEEVCRERDELGEEVAALTSSLSEVQTRTDELLSQMRANHQQEMQRLRAETPRTQDFGAALSAELKQKEADIEVLKQRLRQTHVVAEEAAAAQAEADEQMDAEFRNMEANLEAEMEQVAEVGLEVEQQSLLKVDRLETELVDLREAEEETWRSAESSQITAEVRERQLHDELTDERRLRRQLVATQGAAEALETEVHETVLAMQAKTQRVQSELSDERQLREELLASQGAAGQLEGQAQESVAAMEGVLREEQQTSQERVRRLQTELREETEAQQQQQQQQLQLQRRLDRSEAWTKQLESELHGEQQGKARRLREELAEELQVQQQLAAAEERARRVEAELRQQEKYLATAQAKVRNLQAEVHGDDQALRRLTAAEAKVRQLQTQLQEEDQVQQRLAAAEGSLRLTRSELQQEQQQAALFQGKARQLTAELREEEAVREQLGTAQAKVRQLRSELQAAQETQQELSAAEAQLRREQERRTACEAKVQQLRHEAQEAEERKQQLMVAEGSLQQLKAQLHQEQDKLSTAEGGLQLLRAQLQNEKEALAANEANAARESARALAQAEMGFELQQQELLQRLALLQEELVREQQAGKMLASQRMAAAKVQAEASVLRAEQEVAQQAWLELSEQQAEMLLALQGLAPDPRENELEAELRAERLRGFDLASREAELAQELLDLRCNLELKAAALSSRRYPSPPRGRGALLSTRVGEAPRARSEEAGGCRRWSAGAELRGLEGALRQMEAASAQAMAATTQEAKESALRAGQLAAEERRRSLRAFEEAARSREMQEELQAEVKAARGEEEAQREELATLRAELRSQQPAAPPAAGRSTWRTSWMQGAPASDFTDQLRDRQIAALQSELQEARRGQGSFASSSQADDEELFPWEDQLRGRLEDAATRGGLGLDLRTLEVQISEAFHFGEGDFADAAAASAALEVATALVDAFGVFLEVTLPRQRAGDEALKAQRRRIEEVGAQHGLDGSRLVVREQPATSEGSPKPTARLSFREPKVLNPASATRPSARSWRLSWAQGA